MAKQLSQPPAGQIVSFEKSAGYWLRRAAQHRKRSEFRRASVLLRHAMALEPTSGEIQMEYAENLRDMHCFEASNCAAFGALSLNPAASFPFSLIGRNMLSLGREQESIDAFSHYLQQTDGTPQDVLLMEESEEMDALEDLLATPKRLGSARHEAMIHIASLRMARGNLDRAQLALDKASRLNPKDIRQHTLYAMLYQTLQEPERALSHALTAARGAPGHVPALCALATIRMQLAQRGRAGAALLKAAAYCHYPDQELLLCFTAEAIGFSEIALAMLKLSRRKNPNRLPTLYNMAVLLLKTGRTAKAQAHFNRCCELDPTDITLRYMLQTITEWPNDEASAQKQSAEDELPFYPFLSQAAEAHLLKTLEQKLERGIENFADTLLTDAHQYRSFLYALTLPGGALGQLLLPLSICMANRNSSMAERFLRDVLWQSAQDDKGKRYALFALAAIGAKPPYVILQNGRILQADPCRTKEADDSFLQRLLFRRIRAAMRIACDTRIVSHTLILLHRMDHRTRFAFAADKDYLWRDALLRHFDLYYEQSEPVLQPCTHDTEQAFALLCDIMPLPPQEV